MEKMLSMLRGINVSGQKKIEMKALKALYEATGFRDVITYIQSGNVVFSAPGISPEKTARQIEEAIAGKFGFQVPVIIRTHNEMGVLLSANPFLQEAGIDHTKLHVTFLADYPSPENLEKLHRINAGTDQFIIAGKEVYIYCPEGYGRTKLTNQLFEQKLKITATTRNWKTVQELHQRIQPGFPLPS